MTTDRRQANADVARAMGWTQRDNHGEPCYYGEPPDLYADTPEGAKAREQAEEWLLSQHIEFQVWCPPQAIRVGCWHRTFGNISGCGVTLAEARAEAIVAAARAMQGGE